MIIINYYTSINSINNVTEFEICSYASKACSINEGVVVLAANLSSFMMAKYFSSAVFLLTLFTFTASKEAHLILLDDPGEAVCLDGSPPGFYYREGSLSLYIVNCFHLSLLMQAQVVMLLS